MPTTTLNPTLAAEAYRLFNGGTRLTDIAQITEFAATGLNARQIGNAINRYAAANRLPDPVRRRSVAAAAAYARSAGLPFSNAAETVIANAEAAATVAAIIPTRTFGIEIEFVRPNANLSPETIAQALRDAGLNCQAESYNHSTRPHWKLIHDASSDRELVSPILSGPEGLAQVRTAMKTLRELGCKVTRREGMHVHVYVGDVTATTVANVFGFYAARQQSVFDQLNAACRRGAPTYCAGISTGDAERVMQFARRGRVGGLGTRYVTVNLDSFARYGTVEFRQHAGSLNGRKACDWVEMLLATVQYVVDHGTVTPLTLEGTLGALVGAGLLGRRTAARLVTKAQGYGFACGPVVEVAAPEPAPVPTETAYALTGCDCDVCTVARERAERGEVVLTTTRV